MILRSLFRKPHFAYNNLTQTDYIGHHNDFKWLLHDLWPQIYWGHLCDSMRWSLCGYICIPWKSDTMWIQWQMWKLQIKYSAIFNTWINPVINLWKLDHDERSHDNMPECCEFKNDLYSMRTFSCLSICVTNSIEWNIFT